MSQARFSSAILSYVRVVFINGRNSESKSRLEIFFESEYVEEKWNGN